MAKRKLIIIKANLYTDGDWGTDHKLFDGYVSRYFDADFYEYTMIEDYRIDFRRVFEDKESAIQFITRFMDSLHGREYELNRIKSICEHIIITLKYNQDSYSDYMDGNSDGTLSVTSVYSEVMPIKEIIYQEDVGTNEDKR